jgi:hypothetical protein
MQKALIIVGAVLIAAGVLWPWLAKLPFGRLPGDIVFTRPGFRFYFPITTMVLVSIVVSIILWIFRK